MQEWLNWPAWKASKPLKGFRGSNPLLSAKSAGRTCRYAGKTGEFEAYRFFVAVNLASEAVRKRRVPTCWGPKEGLFPRAQNGDDLFRKFRCIFDLPIFGWPAFFSLKNIPICTSVRSDLPVVEGSFVYLIEWDTLGCVSACVKICGGVSRRSGDDGSTGGGLKYKKKSGLINAICSFCCIFGHGSNELSPEDKNVPFCRERAGRKTYEKRNSERNKLGTRTRSSPCHNLKPLPPLLQIRNPITLSSTDCAAWPLSWWSGSISSKRMQQVI